MTAWIPWVVLVLAAATSAGLLVVVVPALRDRGVVAVPSTRSLHEADVVRGGGLGLLGGLLVAVLAGGALVSLTTDESPGGSLGAAALVVVAAGALGFVDDVRSLPARRRLLAQVALGLGWGVVAILLSGATWAWLPLVVLAVVVLVNATNFMDGANGVAAGHAVVAGSWYALVAVHQDDRAALVLAAAVVGAALGFLPSNVPTARVFLGDVGSYTLGAVWAVLATWLVLRGAPVIAVAAPLVVLLADTGATLGRRMVAGDPVTTPHRLHVYQRLVNAGWSHVQVAVTVGGLSAVACLLGGPSLFGVPLAVRVLAVGGLALVCLVYLMLPVLAGRRARWHVVRSPVP